MVTQPQDYEIFPDMVAEGAVPFHRFVKKGTSIDQAIICGAGEDAIGVAEYDVRGYTLAGAARTGYVDKEQIRVRRRGICIVEAGAAVTAGARVKSDASGRAVTYTDPTMTDAAIATHDDAKINTAINTLIDEIEPIRDAYKICQGRALTTAAQAGDLIEVDINDKP